MKVLVASILLCLSCYTTADEENPARLLASKNILNQYLVEGRDLTVEYKIYNIGGSAALDVSLRDDGFPESDFEVVRGNFNFKWDRIAPTSNVTHVVVIKPLQYGYFNFTSGVVSYRESEGITESTIGYTTAPGEGGIVNSKDFDRKFSPHVVDWTVFAVMTLPSLVIPFLLFYRSKSRYDQGKQKKN